MRMSQRREENFEDEKLMREDDKEKNERKG